MDTVHVFDVLDIVTDAVCPCSDAEMKDVGLRGLRTLGRGGWMRATTCGTCTHGHTHAHAQTKHIWLLPIDRVRKLIGVLNDMNYCTHRREMKTTETYQHTVYCTEAFYEVHLVTFSLSSLCALGLALLRMERSLREEWVNW